MRNRLIDVTFKRDRINDSSGEREARRGMLCAWKKRKTIALRMKTEFFNRLSSAFQRKCRSAAAEFSDSENVLAVPRVRELDSLVDSRVEPREFRRD